MKYKFFFRKVWQLFTSYIFSETCSALDSIIQYHVQNIPNLIDKGKQVAKKEIGDDLLLLQSSILGQWGGVFGDIV